MRTKCYCNRIYGASDDLLEIDGALIEDEVNKIEGPFLVKCSDGTIANFIYDDEGQWKCEVKSKGAQFVELIDSVGDDKKHSGNAIDCTSYSDVLIVREPLAWISVNRLYYRPTYKKQVL